MKRGLHTVAPNVYKAIFVAENAIPRQQHWEHQSEAMSCSFGDFHREKRHAYLIIAPKPSPSVIFLVKRNLKILGEHSHWWKGDKSIDWAIEKDGHWYRVSGSEFPEKNTSKKDDRMQIRNRRAGERSNRFNPWWALIVVSVLLGFSLALNLLHYLFS